MGNIIRLPQESLHLPTDKQGKTAKLDEPFMTRLEKLPPVDNEIADSEIPGFHLVTRKTSVKSFVFRYTSPVTGKRQCYTIGKYGKLTTKQARDIAKQKSHEIGLGRDPQLEKKQLRENEKQKRMATLGAFYFDHYKPLLEIRRNGGKIIAHLEKTFIEPWKHLQLTDINKTLIEKWRVKRITDDKVSASTINRDIAPLRALLNEAFKVGLIPKHPLTDVKKLKEDTEGVVRYFNAQEKEQFLNALITRQESQREARSKHNDWLLMRHKAALPELTEKFTDYLMPLCLLAMNTGMRRGEIFLLRWEHINFSEGFLTVKSSNTKSGKHRHIHLNKVAFETLKAWKIQEAESDFVFLNPKTQQPFTEIKSSWKNLLKEAEICNFRFHDLRHNFASHLVMAGVDLYAVKELLGHASIEQTQRYAHLAPNTLKAAVSRLDEAI